MLEGCVIYTFAPLPFRSLHILSSPYLSNISYPITEGNKKNIDDFIDNNIGGCAKMSFQAVMVTKQAQEMNIYNIIVKCPP